MKLMILHRLYWGKPLDSTLTTLPTSFADLDGPQWSKEGDPSSDILPGDAMLDAFDIKFLVRAEYIRVFDWVNTLYRKSKRLILRW